MWRFCRLGRCVLEEHPRNERERVRRVPANLDEVRVSVPVAVDGQHVGVRIRHPGHRASK
jgi:hypothetical protein